MIIKLFNLKTKEDIYVNKNHIVAFSKIISETDQDGTAIAVKFLENGNVTHIYVRESPSHIANLLDEKTSEIDFINSLLLDADYPYDYKSILRANKYYLEKGLECLSSKK